MDYFDAHIHTSCSDGNYSVDEVIRMAADEGGIRHLAITDHNKLLPNLNEIRNKYPNIEIISGSEISAEYYTSNAERKEIHIVGLFLEHTNELISFLLENTPDSKIRFEAMLGKLRECGVNLRYRTFDSFRHHYYPERKNLGRPQLADVIAREGYAPSAEAAMDMYIGDYGERRAYIPNPHTFADMRSVINIIHQAGGVAILAHPFSYNLSYDEVVALVRCFKALKGDAIEVYYSSYDIEKRRTLARIADENNLLYSCASDFHGSRVSDRLDNHFPAIYLDKLREKRLEYIKE